MTRSGSWVLVEALRRRGFDTLFYLMGGPMLDAEREWRAAELRAVDVRHEEAAAMMACGFARVARHPAVCMAGSGPGMANLVAGLANAWADAVPLLVVAGSASLGKRGRGCFQECDQMALARPVTRCAEQARSPADIPRAVDVCLASILARPGPGYLDLPADVLYARIDESEVDWWDGERRRLRPAADAAAVVAAAARLRRADRPLLLTGSGVLWAGAEGAVRRLAQATGICVLTTPQGRGVLPEDHPLCPTHARSVAFAGADCVLVVGTRLNWIVNHLCPPRFAADVTVLQVDVDPEAIGRGRPVDVGLVGDAAVVCDQLTQVLGQDSPPSWAQWAEELRRRHVEGRRQRAAAMATDQLPIHPLRLCREVGEVLPRDAVLIVDGHEILNFARQAIPAYCLGRRLDSGTFAHMGVGLPYALGARVAEPRAPVVALVGDGSLGMSVMELDTAVRHHLDVVVVVSNNGGWTSSLGDKPGRDLGFTAYHDLARALGCHAERVERPEGIRPALQRALVAGRPALVDVVTDPRARSTTVPFALYEP